MLLLQKSNKKKKFFFTAVFIVCIIAAFFLVSKENKAEIVILAPDYTEFKVKPSPDQNLVQNLNSDKTIYDNFAGTTAIKGKKVSFLPAPEDPLSVTAQSGENNIFAMANSQDVGNAQINSSSSDSIWEIYDSKVQSSSHEKEVEPNKLKITAISANSTKLNNKAKKKLATKYHIQLAYARSESEAMNSWNRIKVMNKAKLQNAHYKIIKQKKSASVMYELLIGPFDDFKDAKHLCTKLKLEKTKCLVIKS